MIIFGVNVTQSNIAIFLGLLGSLAFGLVLLYWRLRKFWFDQQQLFMAHVKETISTSNANQVAQIQQQLDNQTAHIEDCIHKVPGHPESSNTVEIKPEG